MRKTLTAVGNSLALVIDRPILELLEITRETELRLTTDGRRLIIEPTGSAPVMVNKPPAALHEAEIDFTNPRSTLPILDELQQRHHMRNEQFQQLHHHNYANMIRHRHYCEDPKRTFQPGGTNEATAKRLFVCLQELNAGATWDAAIAGAVKRHPR